MSAAKFGGKWLYRFVQMGIDQTKTRINPIVETRNHAQFARQRSEPGHSPPEKLDRDANRVQHATEVILLGECWLKASWDTNRRHLRQRLPKALGSLLTLRRKPPFVAFNDPSRLLPNDH